MDNQPTLQWFEYVCDLLTKNPNEATKLLLSFRNSIHAIHAREFLLNTTKPIVKFQAALILQYACILRWDTMAISDKNELRTLLWNLINPMTSNTQASGASVVTLPTYATNKITQLFVLTWKRGYCSETMEAKQNLFFQLKNLVETAVSQPIATRHTLLSFSLRLTRYLIEEFHTYNSMNQCFSLSDHINIYKMFQNDAAIQNSTNESGLQQCLGIALQGFDATSTVLLECYSGFQQSLESSTSTNPAGIAEYMQILNQHCVCMNESCKLLLEILCWEFNVGVDSNTNHKTDDDSQFDKKTIILPVMWQAHFINSECLKRICMVYEVCRSIYLYCSYQLYQHRLNNSQPHADFSSVLSNIRCCFISNRNLTNCFVSMKRQPADKMKYCHVLLSQVITPCTQRLSNVSVFYKPVDMTNAIDNCNTGVEVGISRTHFFIQQLCHGVSIPLNSGHMISLQSEEYEYVTALIHSLLVNYKMMELIHIPAFTQLMLHISELTSTMSEEISTVSMRKCELQLKAVDGKRAMNMMDLSTLFLPQLNQIQTMDQSNPNTSNTTRFDNEILENGLVDCNTSVLLETWRGDVMGQLLAIWSQLLEHDELLYFPHIVNGEGGSGSGSGDSHTVIDVALKTDLKGITGTIFMNLFKCLLRNCVCDCYAACDEEEDQDEEAIYSVNFKELLINICVLGRYSYKACVSLLLQQLQCISGVYDQLQGGGGGGGSNANPNATHPDQRSIDTILEVLRITLQCITYTVSPPSYDSFTNGGGEMNTGGSGGSISSSSMYSSILYNKGSTSTTSELPMIPYTVLDMFIYDQNQHAQSQPQSQSQSITYIHQELFYTIYPHILTRHVELLQNVGEKYSILSPTVMEGLFQFIDNYTTIYLSCSSINNINTASSSSSSSIAPNPYNESIVRHCTSLLNNHAPCAEMFHTVELALQCGYLITCTYPQETSLIQGVYSTIVTLAKFPQTREYLLRSQAFQLIVGLFNNATSSIPDTHLLTVFYRLPIESIQIYIESISMVGIKNENMEIIQLICRGMYNKLIQISHSLGCCGPDGIVYSNPNSSNSTQYNTANPSVVRDIEIYMIYLTGLCRLQFRCTPINLQQRSMLHQLLDSALKHCYLIVTKCITLHYDIDAAFVYYLAFLRDYSEYQLSSLTAIYTMNLYRTIDNSYVLIKKRLKLSTDTGTSANNQSTKLHPINDSFESSYSSDIFLIVLQILNHLTTRDFMLSEEDDKMSQSEVQLFDNLIIQALFSGLNLVFTHISTPMLLSYPLVNSKYMEFIQLLLSWYDKQMLEYLGLTCSRLLESSMVYETTYKGGVHTSSLTPNPNPNTKFSILCHQLLWCVGNCLDFSIIRTALDILSTLSVSYYKYCEDLSNKLSRLQSGSGSGMSTALQAQCVYLQQAHDRNITTCLQVLQQLLYIVVRPNTTASNTQSLVESIEIPVTCSITVDKSDTFATTIYMLLVLLHTTHSEQFYRSLHITPTTSAGDQVPPVFGIQVFINNMTLLLQAITLANTPTEYSNNTQNITLLINYFQELLSGRAMDYSKGIKNRTFRQLFVLNMKEFLIRAKPLLTYN